MAMKDCPECGGLYMPGDKFCENCGAHIVDEDSFGALGPLIWFLNIFPGLVRPKVVVMSVIAIAVAGALLWLAMFLLGMGGLFAAFAIGAFALVTYWTAVSWLIYGYICLPAEAMAEFNGTQWFAFMLTNVLPAAYILWRMKTSA